MCRILFTKRKFTSVKFGAIYNWWAASYNGGGASIAPSGWHVPTNAEFMALSTYLGGDSVSGGKLKQTGPTYWNAPNSGATNEVNFNGRGGGSRVYNTGVFTNIKALLKLWSADNYDADMGFQSIMYSVSTVYDTNQVHYKKEGQSIRLIKDNSTDPGFLIDYDGNRYQTVKIDTQVWMAQNLIVRHFNDGTDITEVTDNSTWAGLTAYAMCAYGNDWSNV